MTEVFATALTQWGMAGVAIMAAGYVIWNTHKEERKNKERYEEKYLELTSKSSARETMTELKADFGVMNEKVENMTAKIDNLYESQDSCRTKLTEISNRVTKIESKIDQDEDIKAKKEAARLVNITRITPTIHTLIQNNMSEMKADHVFVALLHNGTQSITGIPFMKMDVIVEKYNPLDNMNDIDYASIYKDEEITRHDKLPAAILQNDFLDIQVDDNGYSDMDILDAISAREMRKIGTKRIMFECIRDGRGLAMGFVCAYSYKTKDIDLELFKETAKTLERIYRDVSC